MSESSRAGEEMCPVQIEAGSGEQVVQMIHPSFSGSEEAITFKVPSGMKCEFDTLCQRVRGGQQPEWMTPESRSSEEKPFCEDGVARRCWKKGVLGKRWA